MKETKRKAEKRGQYGRCEIKQRGGRREIRGK